MRDVRSLSPTEVAIASILAAGLWALQARSWRWPELHMKDRQDQIDKPNRRARPAVQLEGRARAAVGRVCGVGAKARRVMGAVVTPFDSCSFLRTHASSGS